VAIISGKGKSVFEMFGAANLETKTRQKVHERAFWRAGKT
jgi:hypothetical protein